MARYSKLGVAEHRRVGRARPYGRGQGNVEGEILLSLAVEVGRIGIFETDLVRKQTRFSPELCNLLGLPVGTKMSFAEASRLIDERDRDTIQAKVEEARNAADKGRWTGECRVVRTDGVVRWVSISGRRVYRKIDKVLRPIRSIGTVVDITHLKETEAALYDSERRLRLALEAARMGTFEADITATDAHIDEQEARLLGLPQGTRTIPVEQLRKRVPLEDLDASDAKQERMTKRREAYHHEFRLLMPDGSERWLSAYADVKSNRIFGVNFDITRRKLAEAALAQSETRFRTATSAAALGVFEWDPVADIASWGNDRIYEIFGRSRADGPLSKRQFVADYLHRSEVRDFEAALQQAIKTRGRFHKTCRIRRTGGQRRLQIDGRFEKATTVKPARLLGVVADITARKRLEGRAQRLAQRLLTIQEEERRNLAQELHDSTVQHLVAASLMLASVRGPCEDKREKALSELEASLNEAMKELRTFSYLMHPPAIQRQGLRASVEKYMDGFADRSGLVCRLRADQKRDKYSMHVRRSVFRIVQEGLANVYRHASATQVFINLRRFRGRLHVIITDNGRGLRDRPESGQKLPSRPGVGIRGVRMRVRQFGGRLRIDEAPAGGTRLHAVLPVQLENRRPGS